jgi:transposase
VLGATASLRSARREPDAADWTTPLLARRPFEVAAAALANKMVRIAGPSW